MQNNHVSLATKQKKLKKNEPHITNNTKQLHICCLYTALYEQFAAAASLSVALQHWLLSVADKSYYISYT